MSAELTTTHARVAIVGCGPVGMTLGNLLGTYGIPTLVLERNPGTVEEPRAIAIDAEALRTMQAIGLYETVAQDLVLGFDVEYLDARGRRLFQIEKTRTPYGHPQTSSFDQPLLERQLLDGLGRFDCVEVRFGHAVESFSQSPAGVQLKGVVPGGAGFEVEVEYLIGCDGGRSTVREGLGIRMIGRSEPQRWLVIDTLDMALMGELPCRFFCDPARPGMTLHGQGPRRRWEWMLLPGETDAELLEDRRIRTLLAPHTRADRVKIERKCVYAFHSIVAERYREGRVLLAGDAAHMMPPFAGQGLNGGIRDAWNLAWKLRLVLDGVADPKLLDSYALERRGHVIGATELANRLGAMIQPISRGRALLRDLFFRGVNLTRRGREAFRRALLGRLLAPSLAQGVLVRPDDAASRGSPVGQMLVQPSVRGSRLESVPLDSVLGPGFALLGYRADPRAGLDDGTRAFWSALGARFVHVVARGNAPDADAVADASGELGQQLGGCAAPFFVIRPDRFIAAAFDAEGAVAATSAFARLLRGDDPARAARPASSG